MLRLARPLAAASRNASRLAPLAARAQSTSAAQEWIKDMTARPATISKDDFDTLRAAQFKATIPTDAQAPAGYGVSKGDEVPKGMHLIYFQPTDEFSKLAADGTSAVSDAFLFSSCLNWVTDLVMVTVTLVLLLGAGDRRCTCRGATR